MRKLLTILTLCLVFACPAMAEDTQTVKCTGFSVQLPFAWHVDVDEFTRAAYPIVDHILHPVMIFAGDEDYSLIISLYDYPSDIRYRLAGKGDRAQDHFNVIAEHSALASSTGVVSSRMVQSLHDIRNFVICQRPGTAEHIATYYNPDEGLGYTFSLTRKNEAITAEAAEALLLEIASSLREDGHFYPGDASDRMITITHQTAHIRKAASQDSEILKTAVQGESFPYYGQTGTWFIINLNGVTGYVSTALSQLQ